MERAFGAKQIPVSKPPFGVDKWRHSPVNPERLRHPTFQRIFGRAEVSPWDWTSAGTPLNAIARSNWSRRIKLRVFS
jgi:hypothetical protein